MLLALIAARPGPLRPDIVLRAPGARPNATLADQREVSARLSRLAGDGAILAYENAELLYLMRRESPVDAVYFNDTVWRHWAHDGEEPADTALRVTANIAEGRFGKRLSTEEIKTLLSDEITRIMESVAKPLPLYPKKPQVVLVVGVNGAGKTTLRTDRERFERPIACGLLDPLPDN